MSNILPMLWNMPSEIEPVECEAVVYTVLTAPATTPETRGLEVIYRRANGWKMEIRE